MTDVRTAAPQAREMVRLALVVGALGVVFGDLGTSPIYTLQTVFTPPAPRPGQHRQPLDASDRTVIMGSRSTYSSSHRHPSPASKLPLTDAVGRRSTIHGQQGGHDGEGRHQAEESS